MEDCDPVEQYDGNLRVAFVSIDSEIHTTPPLGLLRVNQRDIYACSMAQFLSFHGAWIGQSNLLNALVGARFHSAPVQLFTRQEVSSRIFIESIHATRTFVNRFKQTVLLADHVNHGK